MQQRTQKEKLKEHGQGQRKFKALGRKAAVQWASGPIQARRGHVGALGTPLAITAEEAL